MSSMGSVILLLFLSSLASHQALAQDDIRSASDKVSVDGQARTIYSQRHLSPHRMMHFGKRPAPISSPTILSFFRPERQLLVEKNKHPFLWSFELERGQRLEEVPAGASQVEAGFTTQANRNFYNIDPQLSELTMTPAEQQHLQHLLRFQMHNQMMQQQQQQSADNQLANQKFLKLLDSNGEQGASDANMSEEEPTMANQAEANSADEQPAISVSTRSMQPARAHTLNLPRHYINNLLFGRQGVPSLQGFATYNKKAEPKGNSFMHFGR